MFRNSLSVSATINRKRLNLTAYMFENFKTQATNISLRFKNRSQRHCVICKSHAAQNVQIGSDTRM